MIKLYKNNGTQISYWEAWKDKDNVLVHWGTLGQRGQTRKISCPGETAESFITELSKEPLNNGFVSIDLDGHFQLILQYRTESWGGVGDLEKRKHIDGMLDELLGWTGNGHCDGGDIGSGTINSFCFVVDPQLATEAIVAELRKENLLAGAVIAVARGEEHEVLWPKGYQGKFQIF
jgi:hypothetical protein